MHGHGSHNSQLLVVGGFDDNMKVLGDSWILDLTPAEGPPFWKQVFLPVKSMKRGGTGERGGREETSLHDIVVHT